VSARAVPSSRYYRLPRRSVNGCLLVVGLGLFLAVVGFGAALRALGHQLVAEERLPTRADAIVVMGGGDRHGAREAQAAALFGRGLAPVVLTTGGPVAGEAAPATYAEWSVQRLTRRGVPRAAVIATNEGDSTIGDARGVRKLAEARGWRDVVVVTDNWHSRRTELVFRSVFAGSPVRVHSSPATSRNFDPDAWWTDEEAAISVATEYIKLLAFYGGVD
jgi:uncharacterized SAM-binding protein YcdF (DUF218 family)